MAHSTQPQAGSLDPEWNNNVDNVTNTLEHMFAELAVGDMEGIGTEHEHPSELAGAVISREWHRGHNIAGVALVSTYVV